MAAAERKSDFKLTTDTPYLALTGERWGVYCEYFGENWPRYNGIVVLPFKILAIYSIHSKTSYRQISWSF